MDEATLVANFLANNFDKILSIGKAVYGDVDQRIQTKLRTAYTNYLETTASRYSKAKSFFIRDQPVNLYDYYVPIGLQCGTNAISEPSPTSCFRKSSRIVITGSGGCGKSMLMRHLFLQSIHDTKYVPVFVELRDLNAEDRDLMELLEDILEQHNFDTSGSYLEKALEAGHFCLFFDGCDEVYPSIRPRLLTDIRRLSATYSMCPIALSTRPDDVVRSLDEFMIFSVNPLELSGALELISKLPYDAEIREKFTDDLKHGLFQKHESFLSNPLLLSIMLLTYGENAEIPKRRSVFYNQAYEALFQRHDASKGGFRRKKETELDIHDFARVFALFCLQTYEKRLFKMSSVQALQFIDKAKERLELDFAPQAYLNDLLSATCLLVEDGLEIMFTHRSFQEYFVAQYIVSASDEIQHKLLDRYWRYVFSDNVINLVEELNPEVIERNLLLPRLRKLFKELGVSREVGITHAARYVKLAYSSIEFEENKVICTLRDGQDAVSELLSIAIRMSNTYSDRQQIAGDVRKLLDRYAKEDGEETETGSVFNTSVMSYRSQPLRDVLLSRGAFSISYVQAGYITLRILEKKHKERLVSLDKLLDL